MQSNRVEKHAKIRMFFEKGHDEKTEKNFSELRKIVRHHTGRNQILR